jgi:hypothetical protein
MGIFGGDNHDFRGSHAYHAHNSIHSVSAFPDIPAPSSAPDVGSIKVTGKVLSTTPKGESADHPAAGLTRFRQYSWQPSSKFHDLMKELWKYIQSFEDEHYHVMYKQNINEETLRDYSSAIQEIIPRMAKVQSVFNHNARGLPDMMRWQAPHAEPLHTKDIIKHGADDCQEFAILARNLGQKPGAISQLSGGSVIQSALACQAAASKAAVALQRAKLGDPVCDPKTVFSRVIDDPLTLCGLLRTPYRNGTSNFSNFL